MKILRKILGLCEHDWKIHSHYRVSTTAHDTTVGYLWVYKCSKCPKFKQLRIKP